MYFYNMIKNLDKDCRDSFISYRLKELNEDSNDNKIIGYEIPNISLYGDKPLTVSCIHDGFIGKDTKIVYNLNEDNGLISDRGNYYYINDDSYIYEFFDFICDLDVDCTNTLLYYIQLFLLNYFSGINNGTREEMFSLLVDSYGRDIKPIKEHSIDSFKGKGNALCSEYASMAQNILSILNIDSCLVFGALSIEDNGGAHAYNVIYDNDKYLLVDFGCRTLVHDINHQKLGELPFIGELEVFDDDYVDELVTNNKVMPFNNYSWYIINDSMLKLKHDKERDYYIDVNRRKKKTI